MHHQHHHSTTASDPPTTDHRSRAAYAALSRASTSLSLAGDRRASSFVLSLLLAHSLSSSCSLSCRSSSRAAAARVFRRRRSFPDVAASLPELAKGCCPVLWRPCSKRAEV